MCAYGMKVSGRVEKETETETAVGKKKKGKDGTCRCFSSRLTVGVPRQDNHHGVEINCTVCNSLQDELFICNRKAFFVELTYYR